MDKKYCNGCRNDFYNGRNPHGVNECWSLRGAKMVTRYRIGTWTMPLQPGAFTKVRVPNCYHADGWSFVSKPHPNAVEAK